MTTLNNSNEKLIGDSLNETNQNNYPFYYPKGAEDKDRKRVLTFIDDDGLSSIMDQPKTPEGFISGFWTSEQNKNGIIERAKELYPDFRMGFAIVTGYVSNGIYGYLSKMQIESLQAAGHEIYSHTVDHADANSICKGLNADHENISQSYLSGEYNYSKQWLIDNGFNEENSNVLIYPGGLQIPEDNSNFEDTVNTAKEFYRYAVNTQLTDGYNPIENVKNWTLRRIDFDELSKDEIIDIITKSTVTNPFGWFIAMTHSTTNSIESPSEKQDKIMKVITYCKNNNIDILPFSEAVKYYNKK